MKINDILKQPTILKEYYFPEDDEGNKAEYADTRRVRLTLKHLNKLRKIRELKKYETSEHKKFVSVMYGTPTDEEGSSEF